MENSGKPATPRWGIGLRRGVLLVLILGCGFSGRRGGARHIYIVCDLAGIRHARCAGGNGQVGAAGGAADGWRYRGGCILLWCWVRGARAVVIIVAIRRQCGRLRQAATGRRMACAAAEFVAGVSAPALAPGPGAGELPPDELAFVGIGGLHRRLRHNHIGHGQLRHQIVRQRRLRRCRVIVGGRRSVIGAFVILAVAGGL